MSLESGTRFDQYEILGPLGAGGMGEVYRARDTRLGRNVAIKVLPQQLAADAEALARLEREAKALAALSHPNILTIFDFGTENGVTYAVMELLEGETLRRKIVRGKIPPNKIIEIGSAITEGLAAAHSRGIIHRDLKPENIFLTSGGGVKILDFGLARLDPVPSLEGESRMATVSGTQPGTVLGTIGYMSPEQVRGQALDNRTDIFSLGCILYEMSTGNCPFARNTAADTMAAILNYDPPELSTTGSEIPPELDRLILHCLEKNADDRFQSARDLSFDLKEIASGMRLTKPIQHAQVSRFPYEKILIVAFVLCFVLIGFWWFNRIGGTPDTSVKIPVAVADFINETGEKDLDGLSGMLITSLEQSRRLAVMTRSRMLDVMKQMGQENSERIDEHLGREICKRAKVNALILASIRKFDQLYTIDLKVLDPEKNEYLFTTKQKGTGKASVPNMIDELSEETRRGLNEKANEIQAASRKVTDVTTSNLQAYQHFFKGEEYINKLEFKEATAEFRKAVAIDPNFALAHARISYAISWINFERAREPMTMALNQIDKLPEKERLMILAAKAYHMDHNRDEAFKQVEQILKLYPEEKEALFTMGDWLYHAGEKEKAVKYFQRVLQLDPNFSRARQHLIWSYQTTGQYARAVEAAKKYVTLAKTEDAYKQLYQSYIQSGDYKGAEEMLNEADKISPNDAEIVRGRAEIYRYQGEYEQAETACRKLLQDKSKISDVRVGFGCLADLYAFTGRLKKAIVMKQNQIDGQLKTNDLGGVADDYGELAYFYFWGVQDREKADQALDAAMPYVKDSSEILHILFDSLNVMGRTEEATRIANQSLWGHRPHTDETIRAFKNFNSEHYADAVKDFEFIARNGHTYDAAYARYNLALCYLSMKDYDRTIQTLQSFLSIPASRTMWEYAKSLYLLGSAYAMQGNENLAKENYKKFLTIWKNADPDLPELIEARKRIRS